MLLCTKDVSPEAQRLLASDGWDVRLVPTVPNPGKWSWSDANHAPSYPKNFWAVYTKLHIFNLTEYERGAFSPLVVLASYQR